jgi:hypothetical protein
MTRSTRARRRLFAVLFALGLGAPQAATAAPPNVCDDEAAPTNTPCTHFAAARDVLKGSPGRWIKLLDFEGVTGNQDIEVIIDTPPTARMMRFYTICVQGDCDLDGGNLTLEELFPSGFATGVTSGLVATFPNLNEAVQSWMGFRTIENADGAEPAPGNALGAEPQILLYGQILPLSFWFRSGGGGLGAATDRVEVWVEWRE